MKIIFLDIDGVLNSHRYDVSKGDSEGNIDGSRLALLRRLIDTVKAKIVLTSSWRCHWDPKGECSDEIGKQLEEIFLQYGISLYDKTPEINNDRTKEIRAWLLSHTDIDGFVIFDDIKLGWEELESHVIKTDYRIGRGLELKHIEKATKLLLNAE